MAFRNAARRARQIGNPGPSNLLAGVDATHTRGIDYGATDRLQGLAEQAQINYTYLCDSNAHLQRLSRLDREGGLNRNTFPPGSAEDFGMNVGELAFTDARSQPQPASGGRESVVNRPICQTLVHTVFNGLEVNDPHINFQGVVVAGKDGEKDDISHVTDVSVQTGGATKIRNNGPAKKVGDQLIWTFPTTDGQGRPRFRTQADINAGRLRFLPEIHTIDCIDVAQMQFKIIIEANKAVGQNTNVHEFVRRMRSSGGMTPYSSSDSKEVAARDPVAGLAAAVYDSIKGSNEGAVYYNGQAKGFPVTNSNNKRKVDNLYALQQSNQPLFHQLAIAMAAERFRAEINRHYIGKCRVAAAPNATLELTLGQ